MRSISPKSQQVGFQLSDGERWSLNQVPLAGGVPYTILGGNGALDQATVWLEDDTIVYAAFGDRHGNGLMQVLRSRPGPSSCPTHRIEPPSALTHVVERAGLLHDIGTPDRRFRRRLDPAAERGVLVARSDAPRRRWEATGAATDWPWGGRHEDLSAPLAGTLT